MALVMIPNVSEGRSPTKLRRLEAAIGGAGGRVLDLHADAVHHRSVFTVTGSMEELIRSAARLALEVADIDLTEHRGVHPRLGGLDVCPFVPHDEPMGVAIEAAHRAGEAIAEEAGVPVFLYGEAARRPAARELPALRKGGLGGLIRRVQEGFAPDFGPPQVDPPRGVVCVGARGPLIAFNVWMRADVAVAQRIAAEVRTSGGGPPGIRALGLSLDDSRSQVSMNLIEPAVTGIDAAFDAVRTAAKSHGAEIYATEIIGLVPARYMPRQDAPAARLLIAPGRCLEPLLSD